MSIATLNLQAYLQASILYIIQKVLSIIDLSGTQYVWSMPTMVSRTPFSLLELLTVLQAAALRPKRYIYRKPYRKPWHGLSFPLGLL